MKTYLVGGAIRDRLLGLPVTERDYVVVGSTPAAMLSQGYRAVGKDFPVFLHPTTQEEYALARLERKTGSGYTGFEFMTAPTVTLEDDLLRRDLTINAIAEDAVGQLIDPYNGVNDLHQRILRHVSPAFVEDPVRLLRIARFYARFANLGFVIAPETQALLTVMVKQHEVDALVPERVWQETLKALTTPHPGYFFDVLDNCQALAVLFPEIAALWSQQRVLINTCLDKTAQHALSPASCCACLLSFLPDHALATLLARYPFPHEFSELAQLIHAVRIPLSTVDQASAESLMTLLNKVDAFRRPDRFKQLLTTLPYCQPGSKTRIDKLAAAYQIASQLGSKDISMENTPPALRSKAIDSVRIAALQHWLAQ